MILSITCYSWRNQLSCISWSKWWQRELRSVRGATGYGDRMVADFVLVLWMKKYFLQLSASARRILLSRCVVDVQRGHNYYDHVMGKSSGLYDIEAGFEDAFLYIYIGSHHIVSYSGVWKNAWPRGWRWRDLIFLQTQSSRPRDIYSNWGHSGVSSIALAITLPDYWKMWSRKTHSFLTMAKASV